MAVIYFLFGFICGIGPMVVMRMRRKQLVRFQKTVQANKHTPDKVINGILNAELKKRAEENPTLRYKGYRIVKLSQMSRTYEFIFQKA